MDLADVAAYPEAQGDRANGRLNAGFRYRPALRARYCFAGSDKKHAADRQKESRQLARTSGAADIAADALSQSDFNDLTILAHRFLAGTPSMLAAVRPSDLTDEKGPTTYRGTRRSYYNWPPKLFVPLESLSVLPLAEIRIRRNELGATDFFAGMGNIPFQSSAADKRRY
ncbi:hypothetical protein GAO09_11005 [Rhizobiales bacterium RZME27]|jgi:hypothetical protein|uniref:Uncharacterized protein n=1 Tax=Endobacterium cereale TaxID=2663029 RepID=A0A6A8A5E6_9HYPH|nr:hypothetical protein [Endobacterium cereale]MEB2846711.1 hypothetical protein [Endobacterium cereale]MQY46572.1 hypothetical protein [Endobacterium cereale]